VLWLLSENHEPKRLRNDEGTERCYTLRERDAESKQQCIARCSANERFMMVSGFNPLATWMGEVWCPLKAIVPAQFEEREMTTEKRWASSSYS
jgi:hypothetical protein